MKRGVGGLAQLLEKPPAVSGTWPFLDQKELALVENFETNDNPVQVSPALSQETVQEVRDTFAFRKERWLDKGLPFHGVDSLLSNLSALKPDEEISGLSLRGDSLFGKFFFYGSPRQLVGFVLLPKNLGE